MSAVIYSAAQSAPMTTERYTPTSACKVNCGVVVARDAFNRTPNRRVTATDDDNVDFSTVPLANERRGSNAVTDDLWESPFGRPLHVVTNVYYRRYLPTPCVC